MLNSSLVVLMEAVETLERENKLVQDMHLCGEWKGDTSDNCRDLWEMRHFGQEKTPTKQPNKKKTQTTKKYQKLPKKQRMTLSTDCTVTSVSENPKLRIAKTIKIKSN